MHTPAVDFAAIPSPIILRGSAERAYRDPCGHYHGVFRVWHTNVRGRADSGWSAATAVIESRDLVTWSEPCDVTARDRTLNYSSPGNVIRHGGRWLMCLQTYPSGAGRPGDHTARIFTTHGHASLGIAWSDDLVRWDWPRGSGDA